MVSQVSRKFSFYSRKFLPINQRNLCENAGNSWRSSFVNDVAELHAIEVFLMKSLKRSPEINLLNSTHEKLFCAITLDVIAEAFIMKVREKTFSISTHSHKFTHFCANIDFYQLKLFLRRSSRASSHFTFGFFGVRENKLFPPSHSMTKCISKSVCRTNLLILSPQPTDSFFACKYCITMRWFDDVGMMR